MFTFKILSPRGRRSGKGRKKERGKRVRLTRREGAPARREAHENRFYSLSESAENSYWLRDSREDKCSR